MSVIADLMVKIGSDTSGLSNGMKSAGNIVKGAASTIAAGMKIAAVGVVAAGAAIYAFTGKASDLGEAQNVVKETFKETNTSVLAWSKTMGLAGGISETNAVKFVGSMGAMLKSSGLAEKDAGKMAQSLVGLTGDMSSFYNLPHDVMWEKLRSGISGETEPLKQLGINMSVANLEAFGLAKGIKKSYKEMTQAEQTTLRYDFLIKATADAQGDFGRTLETSFPNQVRVAQLSLETMATSIGKKFLPIFLDTFKEINKAVATGDFAKIGPAMGKGIGNALKIVLDGIAKNLPSIQKAGLSILNSIIKGITDNKKALVSGIAGIMDALTKFVISSGPNLIMLGFDLIVALAKGVLKNLPAIVKAGINLLISLMNGILSEIPKLTQIGLNIIPGIAKTLTMNLPTIIKTGVNILLALIDGIVKLLPVLIPLALDMLIALVNGIIAALPTIIKAMPKIIKAIVDGIVIALPKIIDAAIAIIMAIADFLTKPENLGMLIQATIEIVGAIVIGLIRAIPQVVGGVGKLIVSMKDKLISYDWNSLGGTIAKGIRGGIEAYKSYFKTVSTMIIDMLRPVGTIVGNAFGSAFNSAVNWFINTAVQTVNAAIINIDKIISLLNKIPGVKIGQIKTFTSPSMVRTPIVQHSVGGIMVGGYADGVTNFAGGLARINEGGKGEIVNLPRGANVIPHDVSMEMAKNAGKSNTITNTININGTGMSQLDIQKAMWQLERKMVAVL